MSPVNIGQITKCIIPQFTTSARFPFIEFICSLTHLVCDIIYDVSCCFSNQPYFKLYLQLLSLNTMQIPPSPRSFFYSLRRYSLYGSFGRTTSIKRISNLFAHLCSSSFNSKWKHGRSNPVKYAVLCRKKYQRICIHNFSNPIFHHSQRIFHHELQMRLSDWNSKKIQLLSIFSVYENGSFQMNEMWGKLEVAPARNILKVRDFIINEFSRQILRMKNR